MFVAIVRYSVKEEDEREVMEKDHGRSGTEKKTASRPPPFLAERIMAGIIILAD
jgi:hypothetical protein